MILFIIIFILIIAVSAYLAYLSMRDYYDLPEKDKNYSLFLIRNPLGLTNETFSKLLKETEVISFERLFRDSRSAIVLYAPTLLLEKFPEFKPLEIEDYTKDRRGRWHQFVIQPNGTNFLVETRIISFDEKPSAEIIGDFKKRKISPLGEKTVKMSSKELLEAILLPQK